MFKRTLAITVLAFGLAACATTEYPRVPAYNRYTVEELLAMSKQGEPPELIIQRLEQARGQNFYPLTASDIVHLHDEGMPVQVLDWMQQQYLWQVRREERFQLP